MSSSKVRNSRGLNPTFLAILTGRSQNLADRASLSTCTCGGSEVSWLLK